MLDIMFPHVAKKTKRLMGFLKNGNRRKVKTMKVEPSTEKIEDTRVAISMPSF